MNADPRYPLGLPLNRKPPPALRQVPGRPHWFLDEHDIAHYVDPDKPVPPIRGPL